MFVTKKAKLRHDVLHYLIQKLGRDNGQSIKDEESTITIDEMAKLLNTTPLKVIDVTAAMFINKDIDFDDFGKGRCMIVTENSLASYADRKYIKESTTEILSRLKDYLGITVALVAIFSSMVQYTRSISIEETNKNNIKQLQQQLDTIKDKLPPQIQPKK